MVFHVNHGVTCQRRIEEQVKGEKHVSLSATYEDAAEGTSNYSGNNQTKQQRPEMKMRNQETCHKEKQNHLRRRNT
jgi:hypothetical protein